MFKLELLNKIVLQSKLDKLLLTTMNNTGKRRTYSNYQEAISVLNSLQSNSETLEIIRQNRNKKLSSNIETTQEYLLKVGIEQDDITKLKIIHVAGTKGKGSTCAFVESILHENGYKVGLYSSPHLVVARERIKIGKKMVTEKVFTENFWEVYKELYSKQSYEGDIPAYFKFLTVLAFKIFLKEMVDVAIFEVGIGGEYDCTNVVKKPVVCGITTLDLDHTSILGNSLESIAWQKTGIMKQGIPTFTVDQHSCSIHEIMFKRSSEKESELFIVPELTLHKKIHGNNSPIYLSMNDQGSVQLVNASLALQLAHYWITKIKCKNSNMMIGNKLQPISLTKLDILALKNVSLPGRFQVIKREQCTYFIDGAHTAKSISACINWYINSSQVYNKSFNVLVFNITGDREPIPLLERLSCLSFDLAIFTTNIVDCSNDTTSDQKIIGVTDKQQIDKREQLKKIWYQLNSCKEDRRCKKIHARSFMYISDVVEFLENKKNLVQYDYTDDLWLQILVTGSMHLVGGVLTVIDPKISSIGIVEDIRTKE